MAEKVADYERLLKDLMSRVPDEEAKLIKTSLDKVGPTIHYMSRRTDLDRHLRVR